MCIDAIVKMECGMMRFFSLTLMVMAALLMTGCGVVADKKDFTIRSTITASYDGKPIEGSAVLFQRLENSSRNYTRGEATVLELGNEKRAYLLLVDRNVKHVYSRAIYTAYGPEKREPKKAVPQSEIDKTFATPVGTLAAYNYKEWANRAGKRYNAHPLLIAFKDETDPTSVFIVETEKPTVLFGKRLVFNEWSIERVANNTPLTKKVENYLPWANRNHPYWAGKSFDYLETPHRKMLARDALLKHRLARSHFSTIDQGIR